MMDFKFPKRLQYTMDYISALHQRPHVHHISGDVQLTFPENHEQLFKKSLAVFPGYCSSHLSPTIRSIQGI